MKAVLQKTFRGTSTKNNVNDSEPTPKSSSPRIRRLSPPNPNEILRYRYHHSTNLGSIFTLEKWLHGSMFEANCTGDSELDAVTASIATRGIEATRAKWETHWSSALSDDDLHWLSNTAKCTTLRLPVGFFTLGPSFCTNTPFSMQAAQVYTNAWTAVKSLIVRCLEVAGIGVLLDFHAVPGGANSESHSGTSSREAGLWKQKSSRDLALQCLCFMAQEITNGDMTGVVGIQLCNEAQWEAPGLYKFYDKAIAKISDIDSTLPIYISDAWNLESALLYSRKKNSVKPVISNPVIVDTHLYYTFAEKDTSRPPQDLIAQVSRELSELHTWNGNVFENEGACNVYIGEYSCTLSQETWTRVPEGQRATLTLQFGQVQTKRWQQMACGSAFWTMKMDWMPGGDWGFKNQVDAGSITAPKSLYLTFAEIEHRTNAAERLRNEIKVKAEEAHRSYWDQRAPGAAFEHWRFTDGWEQGWADARDFLRRSTTRVPSLSEQAALSRDDSGKDHTEPERRGGDQIGALDLWVLKRMKEVGCAYKRTCKFGWEWEQGFRQGVAAFYAAVDLP